MAEQRSCSSCNGSGEVPTDYGSVDCPDCGGAGFLPSHHVLVDWRTRDLERSLGRGNQPEAADVLWMLAELRRARAALTEVVSLAHDIDDASPIGSRIRFVANRALGLWDVGVDRTDATHQPGPNEPR